jgi:nucleoredoxin
MSLSPALAALLGPELIKNDGSSVATSTLAGKYLFIYFSASWCGPCQAFTPQLVNWYNDNASKHNAEIVFVSSDRTKDAFDKYFAKMPWLALPMEAPTRKALGSTFRVEGIPHLVLLSPEGKVITENARRALVTEPAGFPWPPQPMTSLLPESIKEELEKKNPEVVGLYFSASWCGPCRKFTPLLKKVYENLNKSGTRFEIVFVTADNDESDAEKYAETMPWLKVPFGHECIEKLSMEAKVQGIPTLILLDWQTKRVMSSDGVMAIANDQEGKKFPWKMETCAELGEMHVDVINQKRCVFLFAGESNEQNLRALREAAESYVPKQENSFFEETGPAVVFAYCVKMGDPFGAQLRMLFDLGADEAPVLVDFNVAKDVVYKKKLDGEVTRDAIVSWLTAVEKGEVTGESIEELQEKAQAHSHDHGCGCGHDHGHGHHHHGHGDEEEEEEDGEDEEGEEHAHEHGDDCGCGHEHHH